MIDSCPSDIINKFAEWLSPQEISRFASSEKSLRTILPAHPLRIKILTRDRKHILNHSFLVSDEGGRTLRHEEHLKFGRKYRFWLYDELRFNRVDLVRQIPIGDGFDITLQPQQRKEGDFCLLQLWNISHSENASDGDLIEWNTEIGLSVGGDQDESRRASSVERKLLSFSQKAIKFDVDQSDKPSFTGAQWHATTDTWGPNEKMCIVRSDDETRTSTIKKASEYLSKTLLRHSSKEKEETALSKDNEDTYDLLKTITKTTLEFRAPRVLHDDRGLIGYYSQRSLKAGTIDFERYHATVKFELWTDNGYMILKSESLDYALAIPIIFNNKYDAIPNEPEVLDAYYNIKYFYAWAGKFYLAASADAKIDVFNSTPLEGFGERSKVDGKPDETKKRYIMNYNEREETAKLDKTVEFPRDPSVFFYCVLASRLNC